MRLFSFNQLKKKVSVSKAWCVKKVNAMIGILHKLRFEYIRLPVCRAEWLVIEEGFRRATTGFPLCCSSVDGCLVAIQRPREYEGWYCRKGMANTL